MLEKITEGIKNMLGGGLDGKTMRTEDGRVLFDDEVISYVKQEFHRRQQERLPLELQWRLNINFKDGNQYVEIDAFSNTITESVPMFWYQEREVFNHIAPIVETRLAKLKRLNPVLKVRPASSEKEDISSAKVSNKILEGTYNNIEMPDLQAQANAWAETCGTAIWKHPWNPNKGKVLGMVQDNSNQSTIREGDIDTMVISPFEIYPDSIWGSPKRMRSIIHAKAYHIDEVYEQWGIRLEGKEVHAFGLKNNTFAVGGLGLRSNNFSVASQMKKNNVIVYEYSELPSKVYPKGRLIICTDDRLLYKGDLPYNIGQDNEKALPFVFQYCIEVEGCMFGKSIVERLIPIQRRYNALKNRIAEYLNRCAIGNLIYEENSIDETQLEEEGIGPGTMIPVKKSTTIMPRFMDNPPLPAGFIQEEQSLLGAFITISGVSEVSRDSSAPTGVNSGIALQILQEQDDTRLSLTAENIKATMIQTGKMWLRLYKQFAQTPRILRSVGKDNTIEVLDWSGSDITSDDVYIEASSLLSETLSQRRQMVFDLLQGGLFNDPETGRLSKEGRNKVFEMIQLGDWENYDDTNNLHIQRVNRENRNLMQGIPAQIMPFDDDIIHINKHNAFRLSADFEELIEQNPMIMQVFEMHVQEHMQSLQAKMPPQQEEKQGEMQ